VKRLIYVVVPLVVLGTLIGWRLDAKKKEVAAQARMREMRMKAPPVVSVALSEVRDIQETFESVGTVEAPYNVRIAPKVSGGVDFLEVREGDRVVKGQVLVRLDPSEVEAQVRQQEAALAEAQYRLAQAQITQSPNDVAVSTQVRQQEATLASARADYNQVFQNYNAQVAAAASAVTDAQAKIDSANAAIANARAAIRSAQASLENARARYSRIEDLYKQGFVAAQDVDDARTAVSVQQGALDVAQGQLNTAMAQRDSATAQKQAAEHQADIVKTKGKADIEAARAKVEQAQAALEYARANTVQTAAYRQNLAALKAAVAVAQAGLKNARAQLQNTVLRSSIDGFVTARTMDPGAMATPGQPILTIQAIRQVWVTVSVPEEISRKIYIGQPAQVAFDALPERIFNGKVVQINPAADSLSRQFSVRILLDNAQNLLKPGMFARVTMVTQRVPSAVVVPREAIQNDKTGPFLFVVDDADVSHRRPVTPGASDAHYIAIIRGVRPGEKIVVLSAAPLKDGQTVRVSNEKQKEARQQENRP